MIAALAEDDVWGLSDLLRRFTGLVIRPTGQAGLRIVGDLEFCATPSGLKQICDSYEVRLEVPARFPREVPSVWECGRRIPNGFHKLHDGALCLGSPFRQHAVIAKRPTLLGFVEGCVVPYLYGFSYRALYGVMPFDELDHGFEGLLDDYRCEFKVASTTACLEMLSLLGKKKRSANKRLCPCGSGLRLGHCHNVVLNPLRQVQTRKWYLMQRALVLRSGYK